MKLPVRRRLVVPTIAAVAVVGGGLTLLVRHGGSGSTEYRTATATVGTVTQTLALSGNLSPVGASDLDFGSSGKISAVNVQPGQKVTAGEVLATLDSNSLQAALIQAKATLSSAQARVSLDGSGPTAQTLAQSQASVRSAQAQVASAQTALTDGNAVDQAAITQAQDQLTADQNSCKASPATSTPTPSPSASPSPTPAPTPNPACGKITGDNEAVAAARAKQTQDQHQEQNSLTQAQSQLANAQAQLATADQSATATQLAQDQAQVQVDQVNVDNAQLAVAGATITAPVAGVVGQVNITVGQLTSGGSSTGSSNAGGGGGGGGAGGSSTGSGSSTTHDIVVLTPGAFEVVGSVSDTQVSEVALNQTAQVSVAGDSNPITGKVTNIAAEPTVTSGVATFPVTVVLSGTNSDLHSGVSASVSLVINQVSDVLTVPTSAVRPNGAGDTVETLVNNQVVSVPVTIGATDSLRTQIQSGLTEGETVVVATLSSVVPTPNVSNFGAFPGGGTRVQVGGGGGGRGGAGGGGRAGAGG